jgi:hypothetical protein
MKTSILGAAAVTAALGFWTAGSVEAATCNVPLGGPNSQDYTVNVATVVECASGNLNDGTLMIGTTEFTQGIDDTGTSTAGSPISWGTDPMSNEGGSGLLPWSINLIAGWTGDVLLSLKQANSYGLFDVTASCDFGNSVCSGTWSAFTNNPGGGSENDLSNTRAWYATDSVNVIPLPAAGWLLVAGLGGLMAMRRRKQA